MSATWRVPETDTVDSVVGSGLRGISNLIKVIAVRVRARRERGRTLRRLRSLDEHTLRDIGVPREDLGRDASDWRGVAGVLELLTDLRPR